MDMLWIMPGNPRKWSPWKWERKTRETCMKLRRLCMNCRCVPSPQSNSTISDRKSTRLNSSHQIISYAVFCPNPRSLHSFPTRRSSDLPRPVDLERDLASVHGHALDHARQSEEMVSVEMGEEDAGDLHEAEAALHELPLRPFAAVEQHDLRSEEHTSELQSPDHLVCRLLPQPPISTLFPYTTLFRSPAARRPRAGPRVRSWTCSGSCQAIRGNGLRGNGRGRRGRPA